MERKKHVNILRRHKNRNNERGQTLPMYALFLVIMILFAGLAIDLGYAYVTRANLSKAADAAALVGMRNLPAGQANAIAVAKSTFAANYQSSGRDTSMPDPNVTFTTDPNTGLLQINVNASTTINTFFARLLPGLKTLTVDNTAQSTRADVLMTIVLDRSGSMNGNGGAQALPIAVQTFLTYFSDSRDQVALASFASNATLDQAMGHSFTSSINSKVSSMNFNGATYALGGMALAQTQETANNPPNVLKVVVFFTDGIANTIQDDLKCAGYPLINYGGNAPSEGNGVWFMDPKTGNTDCQITSGGNPGCCTAKTFPSQQFGKQEPFTTTFITDDAQYRMLQIANTLRAANPSVVVYAVGLGNEINQAFLKQLANTTDSSTYNSSQPTGKAVFATYCPGSSCTADLQQAFQTVATDILLRLTQ
jgi:Flp pilus assembly protein TadG